MQLKALRTFRHGSTTFRRGASVTMLSAPVVKDLTAAGLIEEVKPATPPKPAEKPVKPAKAD
ncbi:hypothetical protein ABID82_002279 [Methylobacterium sp. PvP062]|uniref:Uncharacterized protein n=1 Tax=Methylobacterium radiotolerans TaxID=31998 RepID=A0ABV2NN42_9HYPH|nr:MULTISPECIES: hypothetical protein [unclassified Methylobacterium]MBP2495388.1 hypothetical protein [Methylobacterium sp. PvP105]MBP2504741.1 hypothetical protein [Methylobacterium sp. PvP109]MCX7335751.1 hypothetical protein [Hyphomicrobiales bacterium]